MINKNKGITIITLVITIIILLILAGISIATLTGNDGIINKTKKAAKDYENAQEDELAKLNSILDYSIENSNTENQNEVIIELIKEVSKLKEKMSNLKTSNLEDMYPIGSIYISTDLSTADKVGEKLGGTWESYGKGRTLIGVGTESDGNTSQTFNVNSTGGEYNHTLTIEEMPMHTHIQNPHWHRVGFDNGKENIGLSSGPAETETSVYTNFEAGGRAWSMITHPVEATNQYTGGSNSHNNVQPYIAVYMWKRVN